MTHLMDKIGRIGVVMGGPSAERAVSLKSGQAIVRSLTQQGFDVVGIDLVSDEPIEVRTKLELEDCAFVFIALHGYYGEDGGVQRVLNQLHIPFTGSDTDASRRSFYKNQTQKILKSAGIIVPEYVSLTKDSVLSFDALKRKLYTSQYVVKPATEGSSIGVHLVDSEESLKAALQDAFTYSREVLVEAFIQGRECTVAILNGQALPIVEIKPSEDFFNFEAKYKEGSTTYQVPAHLSDEQTQHMQSIAVEVFNALECQHFARVDFILGENDVPYCLEINTIPGFTPTSLLPKAAACAGMDFHQLTFQILECAYGQKEKTKTYI